MALQVPPCQGHALWDCTCILLPFLSVPAEMQPPLSHARHFPDPRAAEIFNEISY